MMEKTLVFKATVASMLLCCSIGLSAQDTQNADPVPYTAEEFPEWMLDLRRGEIVAVGAFPFMLFFTGFGYDTFRFISNGFNESYRPWPFKSATSAPLKDEERITILSISAGLSLTLAFVDYLVGLADEKNAERRKAVEERRRDLDQARRLTSPVNGEGNTGTGGTGSGSR